ncbi:hypothetical protein [Arcicella lustrica]|uniref:SMODS and SLOG-associating 2TM effector domain-containing protein n=2 Tax=Arcicella TaxID=217140 RepID=A0ABU5SMI1_9BACT|nr:hypothetical protein [Arcicella sp. DC25W]MEA5428482.1 hypothetical protein [Arcicella sp. DC25W]
MIDRIKSKKNRYLILYRTTRVLIFILGAMISILSGTKSKLIEIYCFNPEHFILVISISITVFTAIESLFGFRDKGKGNNMLLYELRRLRDRICFDYSKNSDIYNWKRDEYFKEYQKLLEAQKLMIENSDNEEND